MTDQVRPDSETGRAVEHERAGRGGEPAPVRPDGASRVSPAHAGVAVDLPPLPEPLRPGWRLTRRQRRAFVDAAERLAAAGLEGKARSAAARAARAAAWAVLNELDAAVSAGRVDRALDRLAEGRP